MHRTGKSVTVMRGYSFFKTLLLLYPESYRKKFGHEMLITFEDVYQAQLAERKKLGMRYWFSVCVDIGKSAIEQHIQLAGKQGMKKYMRTTLHINTYNIIGGMLLLPFITLFMIDFISRIVQGDLTHYNRPVYAFVSHTPLYWYPVLFSIVFLFPALAVISNLIPLVQNGLKNHGSFLEFTFMKKNAVSLVILAVGIGFLALIKLHDFAPCVVHGLLRFGIGKLPYILSYCRNA